MNKDLPPLSVAANSLKLGRYQHFKGDIYEVVGVARSSDDGVTEIVVYRSETDSGLWVRPLAEFLENIASDNYCGPRFKYLGE